MKIKKILIPIGGRANYSSIKSLLYKLKDSENFNLKILLFASAILDRYGNVKEEIQNDGFNIDKEIDCIIEGETPLTMAKTTGLALIELSTALNELKPDYVFTIGDRYETMATAIAASYMNIPLIHTMGGEVSGTIDERIRHAVTKLSDLHFPASEDAKNRILKLGENKLNVFNVGCPRIDTVKAVLEKDPKINRSQLLLRCTTQEARPTPSTDDFIDLSKPFLLVSQHPVTTEFGENERHINQTLEAIEECDTPAVILWPNSDAGSDEVSRGMRKWRERTKFTKMHFFKDLDNSLYIKLMAATGCLVGNSSSGIREGAFIGTPVVNIGTRQNNRERGVNVIDVDPKKGLIVEAIKKQLNAGRYPRNNIYGDGNASDKIIKILKKI